MPRDYRRPPAAKPPKRKQGKSCVWWLIVGVALGVVATKLIAPSQAPSGPTAETAASKGESSPPPKREFMFEKILRDEEGDAETSATPPPPAPRPQLPPPEQPVAASPAASTPPESTPSAPTPKPAERPRGGSYVVQVGSFGRAADAERLKAQLALLGISTSIEAATLSNGRVTHRVRTGTLANKEEARKVQSLLKRHGKDSLTLPAR